MKWAQSVRSNSMHPILLLKPALHGAVGYWDEAINLIPLVLGMVLLLYLYLTSRKRRDKEEKERKHEG